MSRLAEAAERIRQAERDYEAVLDSIAEPYRLWFDALLEDWNRELDHLKACHYRASLEEQPIIEAKIGVLESCIEDAGVFRKRSL